MNSTVIYLKHALVDQNRVVAEVKNRSISELDPEWERAYIAILNGKAVLRSAWEDTIIEEDSVLIFIDAEAIPQGGGGGSNPLNTFLMLAVIAASIYTGGAAGAAVFGAYNGYAAAGILVAGSMLVNAVAPPATTSLSNNATNNNSASPTYSIQAQGNSARVEGAIPEHFGRHMFYPDLAAQPYQEFHNNEQYVYILLCLGRGYHYIEDIFIEDTPIDNFEEVNIEVVNPYGHTKLFPGNVITSIEVVGQELEKDNPIGGFVANPAGTVTTTIGLDFIATHGLFYAKNDGSLATVSVKVQPEARLIDDLGNPLGSWFFLGPLTWVPDKSVNPDRLFNDDSDDGETLFNRLSGRTTAVETGTWEDYHIYSAATATPQRYSEKYVVPSGRYEVRVTRLDTKQTDTRYGHTFTWAGLRAYSPDDRTYGDCTIVGVRMQATSQLSGLSSRKIKVISTRKLPIWNGSSWSAPTATTSIAWAYTYICKQYGLTDAQIDLANVLSLNAIWAARGDKCNGRIDSFISFWDAITKVLSAGRAKPYMQAGVVRVFRDQAATIPVALFSMRNIIKNSLSVDYLMPTTDTADAVDVGYFDEITWTDKRVRATLPGSTAEKPAKIETSFITSRSQAYREGMYQAGCNRYRRKLIKFKTEMEGFIPSFGDLIVVQHDMPAWGQGGEIVAWDGDRVVTVAEPYLAWGTGNHYLALRRLDGSIFGPTLVTLGSVSNKLVLATAPDFTLNIGNGGERTHYSFGWGETWGQKARVLSVKPSGLYSVDIEAINEDSNVHTAETGRLTPVAITSQLVTKSPSPTILGLRSTSMPGDSTVMMLSWQSAAYADHYILEISNGSGSWTRIGETRTANYTVKAIYGSKTVVRVAAVGLKQGPWASVKYSSSVASTWHTSLSGFKAIVNNSGVEVSWDTSLDWNIVSYEVRYGATWNTSTPIVSKYTANSLTWQPTVTGDLVFWLKAIDRYGVYSVESASYILPVTAATVSSLNTQVIDNNVLLRWIGIKGTFPISSYEVKVGDSFDTSDIVGLATSSFFTIFESTSSTYTYWVTPIDTSGLKGNTAKVSAVVAQPPDYVLHDIKDLQFNGVANNCLINSEYILLPVNTTETFEEHFVNNGFATPQAQLDSGYPYYLQPSLPSASYTEIIDYEAIIPRMTISVKIDAVVVCGSVIIQPNIAYSTDGITWIETEKTYKIVAINFRYVRVSINVNSSNGGILKVRKVTVKLDAKLKTAQGTVNAISTDVGGTVVDIDSESFIDIRSIVLTPMSTTAVYAVYDFVDTPNPTQFKVLMFNASGTRISGTISWTIRGVI